jgi:hypothetical protein
MLLTRRTGRLVALQKKKTLTGTQHKRKQMLLLLVTTGKHSKQNWLTDGYDWEFFPGFTRPRSLQVCCVDPSNNSTNLVCASSPLNRLMWLAMPIHTFFFFKKKNIFLVDDCAQQS